MLFRRIERWLSLQSACHISTKTWILSPCEKLAMLVHVSSTVAGEVEAGGSWGLTGKSVYPTQELQANERPCFKKQGGHFLRNDTKIADTKIDIWLPHSLACTCSHPWTYSMHAHTVSFSWASVMFGDQHIDFVCLFSGAKDKAQGLHMPRKHPTTQLHSPYIYILILVLPLLPFQIPVTRFPWINPENSS